MNEDIDKKYNELRDILGSPISDEQPCTDGIGIYRNYENGSIYWTPTTGAHAVYGMIWQKWKALGFEKGPNGYPTTDELDAQSGRGRFNNFQNGTIIWLSGTNEAFSVYGVIYTKWGEFNWDMGQLGFPTTDETSTPNNIGRYSHFEHGSIFWTDSTGAHIVKGAILEAWASQGWERSQLGFPVSDEEVTPGTNGEGFHQVFQGGVIYWTPLYGVRISLDDVIRLPVVMITVADYDGANDAAVAFSDETIRALIDDTNAIYEPDAGIKFALQKIVRLRNTRINRLADWSIEGCPEAEATIPNPDPELAAEGWKLSPCQKEAYDYAAKNYPDKIVVFIRRQTYLYDNEAQVCKVVDENGGGFSHKDFNFIALSSWSPRDSSNTLGVIWGGFSFQAQRGYLAHELGHYFDLTHPMPNNWPKTQEEATQQLDSYCNDPNHYFTNNESVPGNLPDLVWDFDRLYNPKLDDTPGDPGPLLYIDALFHIDGDHQTATKNPSFGAGEFKVYSETGKREFIVKPARHNFMSYTGYSPYLPGNTTGQTRVRITPRQREVILDSLNTLRNNLSRAPYKTMWTRIWFKGLSQLMPFTLSGKPHFIAYNSITGEAYVVRINDDGMGFDILMRRTLYKGLSQLMPFTLKSKPLFIAYNSTTGKVYVVGINYIGKGFDVLMRRTLYKGFSQLMPFTLKGKPHFIAYNSSTGRVQVILINNDGMEFKILMKKIWYKGLSQLIPFTLKKKPHFIAYNSSTGRVFVVRINDDGKGFDISLRRTLYKGLNQLMPFTLKGKPHFIAYNSETGELIFYRIRVDSKEVDIFWMENWAPVWSLFMPFYGPFGAFPCFIAYSAKSGKVNFHKFL